MGANSVAGRGFNVEHLKLNSSGRSSVPIYIGKNIAVKKLTELSSQNFTRRAIITDENVAEQWSRKLSSFINDKGDLLIIIPAGEAHKGMDMLKNIWAALLKNRFDRKSLIINVGGGVVGDLGAFAAATYMRGVPYMQVPTTLLAQTDAAIGGKAGMNFGGIKNIVGIISQPMAVVCDTEFLSTLPAREFISGFAEIIKHSLIADKKLFQQVSKVNFKEMRDKELVSILRKSIRIKCGVVSEDVNETGRRKILNFGHTIGHALEMASQSSPKPLLHGEAVAVGMVAEAKLSCLAGLQSETELTKIEKVITKAGLPVRASKKFRKEILAKIEYDKKNEGERIKWVLLKGIGKAVYNKEQPGHLISRAIEYVLE